jgi:transcriptional regulator with XRE-family HTH domain
MMWAMAAESLGTRIRRARERKRWSQQKAAEALGVALRTYGSWERGETTPRSSIGALEEVLGVSLTDHAEPQDPKELELREALSWMDRDEIEQVVYAYRQRRDRGRLRPAG